MPWVKLDDAFWRNKKVRKAGHEAIGFHARALSFAGDEGYDPHISREWVDEAGGRHGRKLAEKLVAADLWEVNGDGWIIHDFHEYNPTPEQYAADCAKRSAAGKRGASARWSGSHA
jgi:hypothetical protein